MTEPTTETDTTTTDDQGVDPAAEQPDAEPATFPRDYVEKLREEAAGHRVKAKRADTLAERLTTAYAAATGRLADPTDLSFGEALLDDDGLVDDAKGRAAVEDLLERKPPPCGPPPSPGRRRAGRPR